MDQQNSENKTAQSPKKAAVIGGIAVVLLNLLMVAGDGLGDLAAGVVILLALVLFVLGFISAVKKSGVDMKSEPGLKTLAETVKAYAKEGGEEHNHNRLSASNTAEVCAEDEQTHWKKQLDGFLRAGIIDRKEYQTLLDKHKDEL